MLPEGGRGAKRPGHPEGYPGPSRLSTMSLVALARWNSKAVRLASEGGEGQTALSAIYGMCEDSDIGHMAHLLRCASKGRDYTNLLQRGARPAADASSKRPRCRKRREMQRGLREDPSRVRGGGETLSPPRVQPTVSTRTSACVERHIFYNACEKARTP
jgi:hypothetical protein